MAEEFVIKSEEIEDKINQLLPSQGGAGAGVDFSASTMVVPIVDLTQTAEGSQLPQILQTALDHKLTTFNINNATNTVILNTTGYFRLFGHATPLASTSSQSVNINIFDGTTSQILFSTNVSNVLTTVGQAVGIQYDFIVKVAAGESIRGSASGANFRLVGVAKQLADINGNLT